MSKFKLLAFTAIAAAAFGSVPAAALVTFASFSPADSANNVRYTDGQWFTAVGGEGGPSSVNVLFNLLVGGLPEFQGVSASYTLNASQPEGTLPASGPFNLLGAAGSFSILSNEEISAGGQTYAAGTNLLSGSFADAFLDGTVNGSAGAVRGSTPAGTVISYTSDILNFSNITQFDFSLPITAITPLFGPGGGELQDFRATMGGQFSSQPGPGIVPEPGTWAMLVLGFGLVGVSARRRKPAVVAA